MREGFPSQNGGGHMRPLTSQKVRLFIGKIVLALTQAVSHGAKGSMQMDSLVAGVLRGAADVRKTRRCAAPCTPAHSPALQGARWAASGRPTPILAESLVHGGRTAMAAVAAPLVVTGDRIWQARHGATPFHRMSPGSPENA